MHARRFAAFFLGIWLGASLLTLVVNYRNLKQVDRLLADAAPVARLELKALGPNAATLFRHKAAQDMRRNSKDWCTVQIGIGVLFLGLMVFGSHESGMVLVGILAMVIITALERFFILPQLSLLGGMLDFVSADQGISDRNRLWVVQTGYYFAEGVKLVLGLMLTGGLIFSRRRSGRSRDARREFDVVNKPNYRRVDG